jgi:hypothetical protein
MRGFVSWRSAFASDREIGKNRQNTTVNRIKAALEAYGQSAGSDRLDRLREVFTLTGAGANPEVLRFITWLIQRGGKVSSSGAAPKPASASKPSKLYGGSR